MACVGSRRRSTGSSAESAARNGPPTRLPCHPPTDRRPARDRYLLEVGRCARHIRDGLRIRQSFGAGRFLPFSSCHRTSLPVARPLRTRTAQRSRPPARLLRRYRATLLTVRVGVGSLADRSETGKIIVRGSRSEPPTDPNAISVDRLPENDHACMVRVGGNRCNLLPARQMRQAASGMRRAVLTGALLRGRRSQPMRHDI